jgi:hypothetical protein
MVNYIFPDFLQNPTSYDRARRLWQERIEQAARAHGQGTWEPWVQRAKEIRGDDLDLYPIADGRSDELDRAFSIEQHPPEDDGLTFTAWLTEFPEDWNNFPRNALYMSLVLSEESLQLAEKLLNEWMSPSTTPSSITKTIMLIDEAIENPESR